MSKIIGPPQSGRVGDVVFVNSKRYGQLVRKYSPPRNRKTPLQQAGRQAFGALASQWKTLTLDDRNAWYIAAESHRTGHSGYHYYMSLNCARRHLGLSRLTLPPSTRPSFPINPVGEAVAEGSGESLRIKLPVPSQSAEFTLVEATAPVSRGVRNAQGYRYLCLLPTPVNGLSDITAQLVARFGVLTPGQALFIRTRQQIDGWMDVGKVTRVVIPLG
jgi:hypothetical protein